MTARERSVAKRAISGETVSAIAKAEGVSERQVYRHLAKPEVRALIERAERDELRAAFAVARAGASEAAHELRRIVKDRKAPAAARVAASAKLLDIARDNAITEGTRMLAELEAFLTSRDPSWRENLS